MSRIVDLDMDSYDNGARENKDVNEKGLNENGR